MSKQGVELFVFCVIVSGLACGTRGFGKSSEHACEDKLAGLRLGRDTLKRAYHRFGKDRQNLSSDGSHIWVDNCNHEQVVVDADPSQMIRQVAVAPTPGVMIADCELKSYPRARAKFGSGRGLRFNDECDRVQQLYGNPQSVHITHEDNEALRVMRYSRVNRVHLLLTFEAACGIASGRVQRMTLTLSDAPAQR